ncbi:MAG: hypothetical protein J6Y47_02150 [Bacteroidales bacterium]|nr:hypothetical protein [Bacteroidales bacterium]
MCLIDDILKHKSVSVVGMAKNTGKTVTLNYVLEHMAGSGKCIAVSSIGVDGESIDRVTATEKPEITIYEGMFFTTSEKHYQTRRLSAEIYHLSSYNTSLGRLVTAKAVTTGQVLLSGPADTLHLQQLIRQHTQYGVDLTLVDGALSRLSIASPVITDALILATGAAISANIEQVVRSTKHIYNMIQLPQAPTGLTQKLSSLAHGIWEIDGEGAVKQTAVSSALFLGRGQNLELSQNTEYVFVSGVITDNLLHYLRMQTYVDKVVLVARDFTKIFASAEAYRAYVRKGGQIQVLYKSQLLAITINPVAPQGYVLNSRHLQQAMQAAMEIPVYNVKEM